MKEAGALLSVLQVPPFGALYCYFHRQSSVIRDSSQHRKTTCWQGKVRVFFIIFLVFFFLQQRASSLTNPFHLHSAIAVSCKVGFGIQHTSTCTCAYTVGQKAALSCSCKKWLFIFYQRKGDNSLRLCSFHRKPQKFSRFSR